MKFPIIIAGPCAAETEQQVLSTAAGIAQCRALYPSYTYIYRAGIWKPRTSPETFQGIGKEGLEWLRRVQEEYQLDVATEVATEQQVIKAVEASVDYLWIGARTAANPQAVQIVADAIKSTGRGKLKGVMVKNPVNDDAALWLGNIERLEQIGLPVIAIHRGCNHRPCWSMVYELLQQRQGVSLVIDPSHMSGDANAIETLCVKAAELGYHGWMIETHSNPERALSDAHQQITPEQLKNIVSKLRVLDPKEMIPQLDWLRAMIDEVDDDLWQALAKRMEISKQIGVWKKEQSMPALQPTRYQEILRKRIFWGRQHGLDPETIRQIMDTIHTESVRIQS